MNLHDFLKNQDRISTMDDEKGRLLSSIVSRVLGYYFDFFLSSR